MTKGIFSLTRWGRPFGAPSTPATLQGFPPLPVLVRPFRALLPLFSLLVFAACGNAAKPASAPADTIPIDEAIGQMLLVGFRGTDLDSTNHIVRDLRDHHVGAVILFDYDVPTATRGRNIRDSVQLRRLCAALRSHNPRLLIGIDQEGGRVSRLATRYGFPPTLTAQRSAALGPDSVRRQARLTAQRLARLGINLNFAPVADVDVNPHCPVIGKLGRSFSADTALVARCCAIWLEEQRRQGVLSCLKHFPGHGSAGGDTHLGLVDVTSTWLPLELAPYRALAASAPMVMTAHVVGRHLDPSGLPASLSPRITALLRDTLGFRGVIVTDDLAMGAIADHYTLEETLRLALAAGADLLCLSNNGRAYDPDLVPRAVEIIKSLLADGTVTPERIRQSAARIRQYSATLK